MLHVWLSMLGKATGGDKHVTAHLVLVKTKLEGAQVHSEQG